MGQEGIKQKLVHELRQLVAVFVYLAGFFVVPMNALLQHRGHHLVGAGRSIAVQNFNENTSILLMIAVYSMMLSIGHNIFLVITFFGLFVSGTMTLVQWWYWRNHRVHRDEVDPAKGRDDAIPFAGRGQRRQRNQHRGRGKSQMANKGDRHNKLAGATEFQSPNVGERNSGEFRYRARCGVHSAPSAWAVIGRRNFQIKPIEKTAA